MVGKVLISLSTGLENTERVTVAFLVANEAQQRGGTVAIWLTNEAVRLALRGHAQGVGCVGCPPLDPLFEQFGDRGGRLLTCVIGFNARQLDEYELVANAKLVGAAPMLDWIDDGATVFSF